MKFRESKTSSGKLLIGGKDAEQNEKVVKLAEQDELVLHTKAAGSPFVVIKGKAAKEDVKEAAIFCAKYSRDWKTNHKDVEMHVFRGRDIFKEETMKAGSFLVRKAKSLIVKKEEIENNK